MQINSVPLSLIKFRKLIHYWWQKVS